MWGPSAGALTAICVVAVCTADIPPPTKPNVLYLMADDMRPNVRAYGVEFMHTPNLDQLSAEGLLFTFAYTQYAVCAPSRNSFLSGRRPDTIKCWNFKNHFRTLFPNCTALPELYKKQGYFTSASGKIYHAHLPPNFDPPSWTVDEVDVLPWALCPGRDTNATTGNTNPNYCTYSVDETNTSTVPAFDEEIILRRGLRLIETAEASGLPWFIGIGTHRPHWPWRKPSEFLDLYSGDIGVASDPHVPTGVPPMACNYAGNMQEAAWHCPTCLVPDSHAREYRRHYYASCSYTDSVVGRAVAKVAQLNATDRTIIVFHSDHGYQLGEHNEWEKFTNFELGTRVPLIIKVPWKVKSRGQRTSVMAELVDIYRTLADLTGLGAFVDTGVEGTSLAPLFDDPTGDSKWGDKTLMQKVALSQFARCCANKSTISKTVRHTESAPFPPILQQATLVCSHCVSVPSNKFDYMGYSLRSPAGWRYTEWLAWDSKKLQADWSAKGVRGVELYDHRSDNGTDLSGWENVNLANKKEYVSLIQSLRAELREAFHAPV